MPRIRTAKRLRNAVAVVSLVLAIAACAAPAGIESPGQDSQFWAALRTNGDEAEGYPSIREMAASADAVIRGEISSVQLSRTIQGDATEDTVGYIGVTVRVLEAVTGDVPPGELTLEFVGSAASADEAGEAIAELNEVMPRGPMLLVLMEKRGEGEEGLYRLVNSTGLWVDNESGIDAPLSESAEITYEAELGQIRAIDELASLIRSR